MKFGLVNIGNLNQERTNLIVNFSDNLKSFFEKKDYGKDIKTFIIGVVCTTPQFDVFFKNKKPRYTKGLKKAIVHGIPFTIEDSFTYDIKLDFEIFNNASDIDAKKMLSKEIIQSLSILDGIKSKIKYFEIDRFKKDLELYFKSEQLL